MSTPARPSAVTVDELLNETEHRFERARLHFGHGTHNAFDEAAWLMLHVLRAPIDQLDAQLHRTLTPAQHARFLKLAARRINERIPLAYIIREAWLGPHRFYIDERCIVPRSFIAELLARPMAPWAPQPSTVQRVLDMCTGSGCLAILAALAFPNAQVDAVDLSTDALQVARRNLQQYALEDRVQLIQSDLFAGLPSQSYDLILSNPPYVDAPSMRELPTEYRHEPEMALASGRDGLDATRVLLRKAKNYLRPDGKLIIEIGHNRAQLERAFPQLPFGWLKVSAGDEFVLLLERDQLI